ncbi:MAG: DUF3168 domain-containing protein [Hyphomicrobiaceae bacterium]
MPSASFALQKSIYEALSADAGLVGLLGSGRIFDDAPQRTAMPYLTFGQSTLRDWSTGTEPGDEHLVTLHVWSRAEGRREAQEVMQALRNALHERALVLEGHRLINLRHELSEARREADGQTYHGIVRLRAVTEPL